MKLESEPVVVGAVGKVKIQPLLRDFQAEGESPALGLFHGAAFSTALLPTNSAKEPQLGTAQKSAGIYSHTLPESTKGLNAVDYLPIAVLRMDVVNDFFRIQAFVFRLEVGSIGIHKFQSRILFPSRLEARTSSGAVRCRERLGGMLKYYEREAA